MALELNATDRGSDEAAIQLAETKIPRLPLRLGYLDGLRGFAAFYVVLYHIFRILDFHGQWQILPHPLQQIFGWTRYGHASVGIFIVLSGYCLTLPVVRSAARTLSGGMGGFAVRRARRLLPPYYAALALSLLLVGVGYVLQSKTHGTDNHLASNFTAFSILSHLFQVHNISASTAYTINPAFWSVATEAQIYVLFALILLPFWRRTGLILTVLIAFVIGLAPHPLLHGALDQACPWYLGLFALGMAAAEISMSDKPKMAKIRAKLPWLVFAATSGIAAWGMCVRVQNLDPVFWLFDIFVGCATASLLIYCTNQLTCTSPRKQSLILKGLDSGIAILLGSFSYSIYLIHYPILDSAHFLMTKLKYSALREFVVFMAIVVPVTLCLRYLFHILCERPFMNRREKKD